MLGELEVAVILIHMPGFHRLAATLPYKKDADDVSGHRDRGYPKAIVLLMGVMARKCRSLPRAEAFFRPPSTWAEIRRQWQLATERGTVSDADAVELPRKPIRAGQWRYAAALLASDRDAFDTFEEVFLEVGVDLAEQLGYFKKGSLTRPDITSCIFTDGTELRSQYRSFPDWREDPETGERRLAAIDPGRRGAIRCWLVKDEDGRWRGVDPVTGEIARKLPVDPDALASGKYGPTQAAYNIVPMSVRNGRDEAGRGRCRLREDENSRVTLLVGMDETENTEAATILSCMERICATRLAGSIQCLITDMIIRGKHMVPLYRRCGVIPVTKVAAASDDGSSEDGEDRVPSGGGRSDNEQEKTAKKLQIGTQSHVLPNGKECKHMLSRVDGALVEVDFNEDGSELIEVGRPALLQVKRSVSNSSEEPFRFNEQYLIECPDGAFTFFLCPHKSHNGDDGRHVAENSRIFPERSEVFTSLYGSGRNTSEGGNAQMKDAYPHKRSQASGRLPVLLDAYLYFVVDNAKTWYFQSGWEVVDPLVHVSDVDTLAG